MSDTDFVQKSILEILIPRALDLDIEEVLATADDADATILISSIPQRDLLFFDESLPVYTVLRTTSKDESFLKNQISRMSVALEAYAISSPSNERQPASSQPQDIVWSGQVDINEDPITVVLGSVEDGQTVLLVWKTIVVLGRPRMRLQAPAVLFKISASIQAALPERTAPDHYLPSGVPLPSNILQSLGTDVARLTASPLLSISGLTRNQSHPPGIPGEVLPIKVAARRAYRAVPALSSRIRVQKAPGQHGLPIMIGSLEIDIPPIAKGPLTITSVALTLPHGKVEETGAGKIPRFPMKLYARDQMISLYSLGQDPQIAVQGNGIQSLEVLINVSMVVAEDCHPQVQVRFKANVDFSGATSLRMNPAGRKGNKITDNMTVKPDDQLQSTDSLVTATHEKLGIVIKFTSKREVYIGEPFQWEIFVINRSGRQRRLGLSMLHKRRTSGDRHVTSGPTSMTGGRASDSDMLAQAYTDDNLLYTMMKSQIHNTTQLICLNTDIKIGPLNPGSCYSTQMEFLPLAKGLLHIDAIRLTDYTTNEAVDLRDLPDILTLERNQSK